MGIGAAPTGVSNRRSDMIRQIVEYLIRIGGWRKKRREWLTNNPCCAACGGEWELVVHHKYPVGWPGGRALELNDANLITLCERYDCHYRVGHLLSWRSYNPNVDADAATSLKAIKERPLLNKELT